MGFLSAQSSEIFYVSTNGRYTNNGRTWSTAFATIQKAIDSASGVAEEGNLAQVWVVSRTYTTSDAKVSNVEIYGGVVDSIPVLEGSSAIGGGETGDNAPTTDARGVARGDSPTIGAFEYLETSSYEK